MFKEYTRGGMIRRVLLSALFGLLFWVSSRGRAAYRGRCAPASYVLNNDPRQSIPAETRERVLKAARTLGYQPFAPARSLRAGYSRLVLLVVQFEQVDPNVARDLHYLETGLAGHGYSLIWHVGAHVTAGLTNPSANLTPAVQSEYSIWTRDPEPEVLPTCEELGDRFCSLEPAWTRILDGDD